MNRDIFAQGVELGAHSDCFLNRWSPNETHFVPKRSDILSGNFIASASCKQIIIIFFIQSEEFIELFLSHTGVFLEM
jgi:hypothetical protein